MLDFFPLPIYGRASPPTFDLKTTTCKRGMEILNIVRYFLSVPSLDHAFLASSNGCGHVQRQDNSDQRRSKSDVVDAVVDHGRFSIAQFLRPARWQMSWKMSLC